MSREEGAADQPLAPSLPSTVAIIGLGLIGGSIARDLAERGTRVLVDDIDQESMDAALRELPGAEILRSPDQLASATMVVIATPVDIARSTLGRVVPDLPTDCVITDVGSTKGPICREAVELGVGDRFVGSHPFTGDHRSGWSASRRALFAGAPVFVCPTEFSSPESIEKVSGFWAALAATIRLLDPISHDELMAWTSHLPQIASTALGVTLRSRGIEPAALGPGGRDAVRLAASSPDVWTAITLQNAAPIGTALEQLQLQLTRFRTAIAQRDEAALRKLFRDSRDWHRGIFSG